MKSKNILDTTTVLSGPVPGSIRLLNFLIDLAVWSSMLWVLDLFVDLNYLYQSDVFNFTILSATFGVYYFVMELGFQRTVGKFITKTRVVNLDSGTPSVTQFLLRTFCRFLPLDQFSFLFFRRGFHDYLSGTKVVSDSGHNR